MNLTDEQWQGIKPLIPTPAKRPDRRGRPQRDDREILNGILWIMRTDAQWKDFTERRSHTRRAIDASRNGVAPVCLR
jgi:transposase